MALNKEAAIAAVTAAMKQAENMKDTREAILSELVGFAFSDEKLLMLSRLNDERSEPIFKNLVMVRLYQGYYNKVKVDIRLKKQTTTNECICASIGIKPKECEFCHGKPLTMQSYRVSSIVKPLTAKEKEELEKAYYQCIEDILKLYVGGNNGMGRKELFTFLKSLDQEVRKNEILNIGRGGGANI